LIERETERETEKETERESANEREREREREREMGKGRKETLTARSTPSYPPRAQCTATHCNTLQHIAHKAAETVKGSRTLGSQGSKT